MFDAVRNNKRIVQVFLLLITVPFAMWGLDSYVNGDGGAQQVARVGDANITLNQFQEALREQQDRMRAEFPGVDGKLLDSAPVRDSVLEGLVDQQLLLQEVNRLHLGVSVAALQEMIANIPAFQDDGRFSQQRYEAVLASQGMSPAGFEAQLQRDMALQSLISAIGDSAFVPRTVLDRVVALQVETRQVQEYLISAQSLAAGLRLETADLQKFYDANQQTFSLPEQLRVEYVVLSQQDLNAQVQVAEAEVRAWYDGHQNQYSQPEERRASHILLMTEGADKAAVKARAEALLVRLQQEPGKFADLAREHSQDPGSAAKGGDLGFFARGMMVKPFEDTAFSLKPGELSGLVETDFGYHIIRLDSIRAAVVKPFEQVQQEIEAELKQQRVARAFAEAAENFSNTVYEQSDSLQPAAAPYKLALRQSGWLTRAGGAKEQELNHPKLLEALFSDEVTRNGRNTEVVEVASGTLVAARMLEHKPAAVRPFEEVRQEIEARLKQTEAMAKAVQQGEALLAELKAGQEAGARWGAQRTVSRMAPGPLDTPALAAVFKLSANALPAYAGVELPGQGYALYKVTQVQPGVAEPALAQTLEQQLGRLTSRAQLEAYMASLRERYKVEVNKTLLNTKD